MDITQHVQCMSTVKYNISTKKNKFAKKSNNFCAFWSNYFVKITDSSCENLAIQFYHRWIWMTPRNFSGDRKIGQKIKVIFQFRGSVFKFRFRFWHKRRIWISNFETCRPLMAILLRMYLRMHSTVETYKS